MTAPLVVPAHHLFVLGGLVTIDPPVAVGAQGCEPYMIILAHPTVPRSWPIPDHAELHLPVSSAALACVLGRHLEMSIGPGQVPELAAGPGDAWVLTLGAGDSVRWFKPSWPRGAHAPSFQYEVPALDGVTDPTQALIVIVAEFARLAIRHMRFLMRRRALEGCDR